MGKGIVKVQTWGTSHDGGSRLLNFLGTQYRGENPGHASLEMRLPVSEENTKLIEEYCKKKPKIPCSKVTRLGEDGNEYHEYVVRFSFIPGKTDDTEAKFHLNPSYEKDTIYERAGHHTTERHYLEVGELQERRGSRRAISVYPAGTLTEKGRALDFSTPKGQYILKEKDYENCKDLLDTITLLNKKCKELKEGKKHIDFYHPTNKTLLIAATQLGIELPRGKIPVDQLDSIINIPEVKKNVSDKIEQLAKERNELRDLVEHKKEKEINKMTYPPKIMP